MTAGEGVSLVGAVSRLAWQEGPFKAGWESACEEILARLGLGPEARLAERVLTLDRYRAQRELDKETIADLQARLAAAERERDWLLHKIEPEPNALHYDECPYKPLANLPSWETPEDAPDCTCSAAHMASYWKARWILTKGYRKIAEARAERLAGALEEIANDPHCSYESYEHPSTGRDSYGIGVVDGHRCAAGKARAALSPEAHS